MSRTIIDQSVRSIFGARFSELLEEWKKEEPGRTNTSFGEMLNPPYARGSVENWAKGKNIPKPETLKQICEIFGEPEDYFSIDYATHAQKYSNSSDFVTKIAKRHIDFANTIDLNVDFVRALSEVIDFDSLFPIYTPIANKTVSKDSLNINWNRDIDFLNSASVIDHDLSFLQINRYDKRITFHKADLAYLKEVQDKVTEYVQFLFYQRAKEMEDEVRKFNDDLTVTEGTIEDGLRISHRAVTIDYMEEHDRFAKYVFQDKQEKEV